MATTPSNTGTREVIVTQFILIYILAIVFALVPILFLFALPGKAIRQLDVSNLSQKGQQKQIKRFQEIYGGLEKLLIENRLESDYEYGLYTITRFTKDSIDERSMYQPVFMDVKLLFDHIQRMNKDNPGKVQFETMKQKYDDCEAKLKAETEKYEKEHDEKTRLEERIKK